MTVYEVIQDLAHYPADAEVSVLFKEDTKLEISGDTKLDIDAVRPEFRTTAAITIRSVVLEVS